MTQLIAYPSRSKHSSGYYFSMVISISIAIGCEYSFQSTTGVNEAAETSLMDYGPDNKVDPIRSNHGVWTQGDWNSNPLYQIKLNTLFT